MPINLLNCSKVETGESFESLCGEDWEMPIQIGVLEEWLLEKGKSLPKGKYIADIGFSPRPGAFGGGAVLETESMRIMVNIGMELHLSEYPASDDG